MTFYGIYLNFIIPLLYIYSEDNVLISIKWLIDKININIIVGDAYCKKWQLLEEYFNNYFKHIENIQTNKLDDIPIDLSSQSPFAKSVLNIIKNIPYKKTLTYGEISKFLNKNNSSQAIGQVCKNNPFPIIIPCHRVVSSKGIGGYNGKNNPNSIHIYLKKKLLELENRKDIFTFFSS